MKNKFVLANITSNILKFKSDLSKQKINVNIFKFENLKNKLDYAVYTTGLNNSDAVNSCLYININNVKKHLAIKLVLALINYKN